MPELPILATAALAVVVTLLAPGPDRTKRYQVRQGQHSSVGRLTVSRPGQRLTEACSALDSTRVLRRS